MYGRKLSAEAREKISVAMRRRRGGVVETGVEKVALEGEMLGGLREKARGSKLLAGRERGRGRRERVLSRAEEEEVDKILERVARMDAPPDAVVKTRLNTGKGKDIVEFQKCNLCGGGGMVKCPACVGAFGVASGRCVKCFGAGSVFCDACEGAGV